MGVRCGSSHWVGRAAQARATPTYRLLERKVSQRGSSPGGRRNELCPDLCSAFKPPLYFAGARAPCGRQVPFSDRSSQAYQSLGYTPAPPISLGHLLEVQTH